MTIQELEQKIETINIVLGNLKLELENYEKALAELKESKKEGKWKPTRREKYFYKDTCGDIACTTNVEDNWDIWRINNLPLFPTKEACERYWHFMDTVKEKSYEFTTDEWEDVTLEKYHIVCDYGYDIKKFIIQMNYQYKVLGTIYFKTEEDAKYIIDNFKDELMEYFV